VFDAARTLLLRQGYAATTMEEIASLAGLTKRTVYNNYGDKHALFTRIIADVLAFAGTFARELQGEFSIGVTASNLSDRLHDLAERMALAVLQPEIIALRRLLIGETRAFPGLAAEYFDRAPAQVINALAAEFDSLSRRGLLRVEDRHCAAAQFAYLVVGEPLDRAMLVGTLMPREQVIACAREGVRTFLARYEAIPQRDRRRR
jgi:TetR/AcrR family transcriptional repressor of mexJK operon